MKLRDQVTGMLDREGFLFLSNYVLKIVERNRGTMMRVGLDVLGDSSGDDEHFDRWMNVVADVIVKTFRGSDVKARIGERSFLVLALDASEESKALLTDRLDHAFAVYNKSVDEERRLHVVTHATFYENGARVTPQALIAD